MFLCKNVSDISHFITSFPGSEIVRVLLCRQNNNPQRFHVLSPESVNILLSGQAAITKIQRLGGLNNKHSLLIVFKNTSPTSGWQDGWVLAKALFK